jgi:hypothetical protein
MRLIALGDIINYFYICLMHPPFFSFTDDGMNNPWCTSAWKATQALEILGFLSLFAAVVMVSLQMFKFKDRTILKLAGICSSFIGGICLFKNKK